MTTRVEDILEAARSLPPQEQLEVLKGLTQSLADAFSPLATASAQFWSRRSIDDLAREQHVPVVNDVAVLAMPDWPEDESVDELIEYVARQRRQGL